MKEVIKLNKKIIIFALTFVIISIFFVSAGFWDWTNKTNGRANETNIKCYSNKGCSYLRCTAMPGQNTPKCNVNTGKCYCGGVCGDGVCDSYEKSYNTCSKDCQTNICSDGTEYGKCSSTKPKYCSKSPTGSYILTDKCSSCGCPSGGVCQNDGSCLICTNQYDPVCGANGKTYPNDCYARKANVAIACQGTCPCKTKRCSDGTKYGKCGRTQPLFCEDGRLVNKCSMCGCPIGQTCQSDGSCEVEEGYSESFETDFGGWTADHYLECELNQLPCRPLEWDITRSTGQAYDGIYSLRGYLNGDHDDGTIWVERTFEASPNSNMDVGISFYLWSESYSDMNNWPVLAYAGLNNPEEKLDFDIVGGTNEVAGWKKYSYSTQLRTGSDDRLWVAFGFGATWETERTYYMDLVNIKVEETGGGSNP